ncbi:mechanosensitive ion channel family protein [Clostridium neuense]|uniref:Mechanosensitive ion channel family protein n=1 Tax=Clostridium neuense TaxID=1728934 RepID=A0ABW8TCM8_9CLOT
MIIIGSFLKIDFDVEKGILSVNGITLNVYNGMYITIKIILIFVIMYVAIKITNKLIDKTIKKQQQFRFSLDKKRSKTLGAILKSIVKYAIYFFGIIGILTQFFGSKLLSTVSLGIASVGGVAIGFGAQSLIKDIINGCFILLEDQFVVGDYVTIDDISGIVESIELRITKIRNFNGDLHIIPNSKITTITNHSKGPKTITVNVGIAYEESIDRAINVINSVCDKFSEKNEDIIEKPKVNGVTELTASGITIKVVGKVKNMKQWQNENELRKLIKEGLDYAKIEIPYNKVEIIRGDKVE